MLAGVRCLRELPCFPPPHHRRRRGAMSATMPSSSTLLDEALWPLLRPKTMLLVEDCVETSGAFVLHHLIKRSLSSSDTTVVFLALAHPFSHYDRILRKLGCNLMTQRAGSRFFSLDMLNMERPGDKIRNEDGLIDLFAKIQKAVEVGAAQEYKRRSIAVIIDDVSLLEVAAYGSVDHVLDFLHYCHTLTSELDCSLVMLNHDDIYSTMASPRLISSMEYLADTIIKIEPLATGLAKDVHGQLTIMHKGVVSKHASSGNQSQNFHFKVKENTVEYFYPGTRT